MKKISNVILPLVVIILWFISKWYQRRKSILLHYGKLSLILFYMKIDQYLIEFFMTSETTMRLFIWRKSIKCLRRKEEIIEDLRLHELYINKISKTKLLLQGSQAECLLVKFLRLQKLYMKVNLLSIQLYVQRSYPWYQESILKIPSSD